MTEPEVAASVFGVAPDPVVVEVDADDGDAAVLFSFSVMVAAFSLTAPGPLFPCFKLDELSLVFKTDAASP